ncbi:MAG: UDP-glucose 4-epimerase GalE [Bacteroidales bacterium]|jgi:UDP-glucose 4-epimerase|nr:UDP-glucose 4-epimerase GalE [Bacteroidales bacterium]
MNDFSPHVSKKILITGGIGFIGSHTATELINSGYEVIIVDNLSNSDIKILDGIEKITKIRPQFYKKDVSEINQLETIFKEHSDIQAIIHFAASKAVGESVEQPLKYYQNNLMGLINILNSMITYKIPNLIFSSSCTVYGQPKKLPVTENSPIAKAESPYGNTKIISEEIIADTIKTNKNLKAIALRYFNPIGAHPSVEIGELPIGIPNNLIPFVTQTAFGIRTELKVFGNDYNTPDGTPIRDYINVVDLAKAHVKAAERLLENSNSDNLEFFNIGTGKGNSVLEIIKTFEEVTNIKLPYQIVGRRAGDIEKIWAETTKANETLNWKAEISLEKTLLSAWEWEKNFRKNFENDNI